MLEEEKIIKISFNFTVVEKSYLFLLMFLTLEATAYLTLLYCACSRPWKAGKQSSTHTVCLIKKLPKLGVLMHAFTSNTWEARLSAEQAMATLWDPNRKLSQTSEV